MHDCARYRAVAASSVRTRIRSVRRSRPISPAAEAVGSARSAAERKLDLHRCPRSVGAPHVDSAAESLDAVVQPDEAGASARNGPAQTIVANGDPKGAPVRLHIDLDDGRVRVLGGIRERLRDDEVRRHLELFRQAPVGAHIELDRDRAARDLRSTTSPGATRSRAYSENMGEPVTLTAVFTPDENGWTMAQLAEWPAVVTCGRTVEEAREMLLDAAREMVASYRDEGREPPIGGGHAEQVTIDLATA